MVEHTELEVHTSDDQWMEGAPMFKKGETVTGTVIKIEDDCAYVDIGYKYDGMIPIRELTFLPSANVSDILQLGQEVTCRIVNINDAQETLTLSKRQVDSEKSWAQVQQYKDEEAVFEVKIVDVVKGGLVADCGVRGFIPASMIDRYFIDDYSSYKGRTLAVKVKEIDKANNKLILSHKEVAEADYQSKKEQLFANLSLDQVIEGTVQRLTKFGAFIDIGGIDGLCHISELSWHHVDKPSDIVREGDKVLVRVIKIDPYNQRISLSIKAAAPSPWEQLGDAIGIDDIIEGRVKRIVDFGAFIEIQPGIEGLVHISQLARRRISTPFEVLEVGQHVRARVLDVNIPNRRISLSIKEVEDLPSLHQDFSDDDRADEDASEGGMQTTLGERFGQQWSQLR
ncbi:MAG: 30S ribosomal protein S1 [Paenibacillaceae bacterium]|nr:30S ribosomal protein S1 [Paenibacillaceae bacterium]